MPKTSLRYTDEDHEQFTVLRGVLNEKTTAGALIKAAYQLPKLIIERNELVASYQCLTKDYYELVNLLTQKAAIDDRINEIVRAISARN